jgi:hypothetical protein
MMQEKSDRHQMRLWGTSWALEIRCDSLPIARIDEGSLAG